MMGDHRREKGYKWKRWKKIQNTSVEEVEKYS